MKIEFFYKCKDGRVIGKETESKKKIEEEIEDIKNYAKREEQKKDCDECLIDLDD
jgi:hypothetical protein